MSRLDEIRAREQAATPGPWFVEPIGDRDFETAKQRGRVIPDVLRWQGYRNTLDCGEDDATAQFIAHAREDIPWLLAEIERLQENLAFPND